MNAKFNPPANHRFDAEPLRQHAPTASPPAMKNVSQRLYAWSSWDDLIDVISACPWGGHSGRRPFKYAAAGKMSPDRAIGKRALYSPDERLRRDASPWTIVQAVLAPLQFLTFAVSLVLVIHYLVTGHDYAAATASILIKTVLLYTIMITGSIWEKEVFGKWLFAPAFFWEDAFSMLVLGLQTAYLAALFLGLGAARQQMMIAVAAYATYLINATQFLLKLRAARLEGARPTKVSPGPLEHIA